MEFPRRAKLCNCRIADLIYTIIFFSKIDDPIHVISIEEPSSMSRQKPPDYEAVTDAPPSYDDAIKLNPSQLVRLSNSNTPPLSSGQIIPTTIGIVSPTLTPPPPYAR